MANPAGAGEGTASGGAGDVPEEPVGLVSRRAAGADSRGRPARTPCGIQRPICLRSRQSAHSGGAVVRDGLADQHHGQLPGAGALVASVDHAQQGQQAMAFGRRHQQRRRPGVIPRNRLRRRSAAASLVLRSAPCGSMNASGRSGWPRIQQAVIASRIGQDQMDVVLRWSSGRARRGRRGTRAAGLR